MERPYTVLHVSLYHPSLGPHHTSAGIPSRLQHDTSPLLVGRGRDAHLQLRLPQLSRRHLSLEPYLERDSTMLAFCLKVLSRRSHVWVNGLPLRFLEQVPLSPGSRVFFSGVQMVVHVEGGPCLEAFVYCFHLSPSPLIGSPQLRRLTSRKPSTRSSLPQGQGPRVPWTSPMALLRLQMIISSRVLQEEPSFSPGGSPGTPPSASHTMESKA